MATRKLITVNIKKITTQITFMSRRNNMETYYPYKYLSFINLKNEDILFLKNLGKT